MLRTGKKSFRRSSPAVAVRYQNSQKRSNRGIFRFSACRGPLSSETVPAESAASQLPREPLVIPKFVEMKDFTTGGSILPRLARFGSISAGSQVSEKGF